MTIWINDFNIKHYENKQTNKQLSNTAIQITNLKLIALHFSPGIIPYPCLFTQWKDKNRKQTMFVEIVFRSGFTLVLWLMGAIKMDYNLLCEVLKLKNINIWDWQKLIDFSGVPVGADNSLFRSSWQWFGIWSWSRGSNVGGKYFESNFVLFYHIFWSSNWYARIILW